MAGSIDPANVGASLLTLTALEIVLGIDNVIFISILSGKLPLEEREKARRIGLIAALVSRILLLLSLSWVMTLTKPLFTISNYSITGKGLLLIVGGLFLIFKAVKEIAEKIEHSEHEKKVSKATFWGVIGQIMVIDIVFSLDSVITAVGMADQIWVMIVAVVIALAVMLIFSGKIADFIEKHPSIKILALAFLILIGVNLMAEGFGYHIEKGFTYFAMAFATLVELLNIRVGRSKPKHG